MNALLDSAHTWFLESSRHELGGAVIVRLVEGIKASERQLVDTGVVKLGPYFPVRVEPQSRCVEVRFEDVLAFLVVDESYDTTDAEMVREPGRFLFRAANSSFRGFVEQSTLVTQLGSQPYEEFILWCEDCVLHALSSKTPQVVLLEEGPNLTVQRVETWSAS